jgi:hypothetical protein
VSIELDAKDIPEGQLTALCFGEKWGGGAYRLEHFTEGPSVELTDLNDMEAIYATVLVVVVNSSFTPSYGGSSPVTVTFKYETPQSLPFNLCEIVVEGTGIWLNEGSDTPYEAYGQFSWIAEGSFTKSTFAGQISTEHHGEESTGSVTIEIDPETRSVTSFSADWEMHESETGDHYTDHIIGGSVPMVEYEPNDYLVCKITGPGACDAIDEIAWEWDRAEGLGQELLGLTCEQIGRIEITFVTN